VAADVDPSVRLDAADYADVPSDDEDRAPGALSASVRQAAAPPTMNAFELVAMCGGLDLTPRLDQDAAAVRRYTRFHSTLPAAEIVSRLSAELREAGILHTAHPAAFKIKVADDGHGRPLRCVVQVSHW